jgi:beta-lactamase superfamily II metal-dependent hydrolase
MKFYIRNACVEILYTQEDLYPTKLYYFNDCTMVSRVTVAGQTITYLGDVRYEGSYIMSERYGKELESEIVQISHHGFDGGTVELYTLLNPKTCLWPTSKENFTNMSAGKTTSGYYAVDTFILSTLKVPTNIYAEPTSTIMLPFNLGDKITYWEY